MWRTRQAPRFAATIYVSDSSSASEVMPKLGLILKAELRNPLTDKEEQKPRPKPKPKPEPMHGEHSKFKEATIMPPSEGRALNMWDREHNSSTIFTWQPLVRTTVCTRNYPTIIWEQVKGDGEGNTSDQPMTLSPWLSSKLLYLSINRLMPPHSVLVVRLSSV